MEEARAHPSLLDGPTEIALERATNPFLRATDGGVQAHLNMAGAAAVDVFAEIRQRKDNF